jgi:putative ATPase
VPLVPKHLRDANYPGAKQFGHGEGYRYPHDYPDHYTPQEYLPEGIKSRRYYEPTEQGYEKKIKARLEEWHKRGREGEKGSGE